MIKCITLNEEIVLYSVKSSNASINYGLYLQPEFAVSPFFIISYDMLSYIVF